MAHKAFKVVEIESYHTNPGFIFQVRIFNTFGDIILLTTCNPITGKDLITLSDALAVCENYK